MKTIRALTTRSVLLATLAGAAIVPLAANSMSPDGQGERCGKHSMKHHVGKDGKQVPHYLKRLDLTDAQRSNIETLMAGHKNAMNDSRKEMFGNFKALRDLSFSDSYDAAEAERLIDASAELRKQQALSRAALDNAIYQSLTAEQQTQLKQQMAKWQDHMKSRKQ